MRDASLGQIFFSFKETRNAETMTLHDDFVVAKRWENVYDEFTIKQTEAKELD